jgi:hypothetical protein
MEDRTMRKLIVLSLILVTITLAANVFAAEVFFTKRGKRYHKADCRLIQNKESQKIDQTEADKKALKPCGICFKTDSGAALPVQNKNKKVSMQ